mmetsp:Transcript_24374/g.21627  ORF Transcript_24374/g.21627 Transcript_24374/m.21627 type:complete len:125 (+) Transcript_24374:419-793(+)
MVVVGWLSIIAFIGLIFISNLYLKYACIFIFGCLYLKNVQIFVLCTELVQEKYRVYVTTWMLAMNASWMPISAVYFRFISDNWQYLFISFLIINIVIAILSHLVPESPKFLYEKERYEEARQVI